MSNTDNGKKTGTFRQWLDGEYSVCDDSFSPLLHMDELPGVGPDKAAAGKLIMKKPPSARSYIAVAVVMCILFGLQLMLAVFDMPVFGDAGSPVNNEVSQRYVAQGVEDTGAVNTVAGMILEYRAFDTFGESTVLFAAAIFVIMLMRMPHHERTRGLAVASNGAVLCSAVRILIPFVLMFGIYVVLNGHLSPGGGFSGGAVLGAGLILCSAAYGEVRVSSLLTPRRVTLATVCCLLAYAAMKSFSFFTGANGLDIEMPKGTPGAILSGGFILPLNICVGIVVCCTMYTFYSLFAVGEED